MDLADAYLALWNEADAAERRRRSPPYGRRRDDSNRLIEARGYEAIEARRFIRLLGQWLARGEIRLFARKHTVRHRDVVKFDWAMTTAPGGEVEARASVSSFSIRGPIAALTTSSPDPE